jgi:hypothetical protein
MTLPDEFPQPEEKARPEIPAEVEYPAQTDLPEDFTPLVRPGDLESPSRARRRRARRSLIPPGDDERATLLEDLARRAVPSFEFFLFAILSGIVLGAGYLLNSDALLVLGLILAPLLTPWVGMTLAVASGGWRFFLQTLGSLLVAFLLAFSTNALVGLFNRLFGLVNFNRAIDHAKLWWPDLLIVVAGAIVLVLVFVRGERRPVLPGVILAYAFFFPIGAAGFGLGAGVPEIWPNGIFIFLTHLALATLVGWIVLRIQHFKPTRASGSLLSILVILLCVAALVTFTGLAGWVMERGASPAAEGTPTSLGLASPTPGLPPSATPGKASQTSTDQPTAQPSFTLTSLPTPSYAVIAASTGGGALVRTEPGAGTVVASLINGSLVEVFTEIQTVGSTQWVHVRTMEGVEGWVLQTVLAAATPANPPTTTP